LGSLERDVVERSLRNHFGRLEHCYRLDFARGEAPPQAVADLTIGTEDGVVRTVIGSSALLSERVMSCLVRLIEGAEIGDSGVSGAGTVEVRLRFSAQP
jgi:hypothetical protein